MKKNLSALAIASLLTVQTQCTEKKDLMLLGTVIVATGSYFIYDTYIKDHNLKAVEKLRAEHAHQKYLAELARDIDKEKRDDAQKAITYFNYCPPTNETDQEILKKAQDYLNQTK